jgi:hypothetical protein
VFAAAIRSVFIREKDESLIDLLIKELLLLSGSWTSVISPITTRQEWSIQRWTFATVRVGLIEFLVI